MPEDERLEAISQALARLLRRQDQIEARFARMEEAMGIQTAPPPVVATPPPLPPPIQEAAPPPLQYEPPPPPIPPSPALETRIGLNWINIIGVVTLIFGAAFFFK